MSINPLSHIRAQTSSPRYSLEGKKFAQKSHICSILLSASLQVPCPYPFAICLHGMESNTQIQAPPGSPPTYFCRYPGIWITRRDIPLLNINAGGHGFSLFSVCLTHTARSETVLLHRTEGQHFSRSFHRTFLSCKRLVYCFPIGPQCVTVGVFS